MTTPKTYSGPLYHCGCKSHLGGCKPHKHARKTTSEPRCFTAPVAMNAATENRAAHGGIEETDTCVCGVTRKVLTNQVHSEYGPWRR